MEPVVMRCDAVFGLIRKDYTELKEATIVITDDADQVHIGVKAVGSVLQKKESAYAVQRKLFGDFVTVSKSEPISKLFDGLKKVFENTAKLIEEANKNVEA